MPRISMVLMAAVAAVVTGSSGAFAAITVLGNGLSQACFETAEFNGNPKDGIAACTEALELDALPLKDRAATYINRGILYSRIDEPAQALTDYTAGLGIDPSLGEGYIDRGAALIALKRYDEALVEFDKGIALGSNRLYIAYYDRAIVQEALGNVRAAYEDYKKATELEPNFQLAAIQLARFRLIPHRNDGT